MRLSDGETAAGMLTHPRHEAAQKTLADLIIQLRAVRTVPEGYEFQQELLVRRLEADEARNGYSRAVKRMRRGRGPQAGAPEPQSGGDPTLLETWQFEHDVCERIARQYMCIGDALAWRVFGFERRYIIALSQNAPPGVMAGKEGLGAEREQVARAWREDGRFALLHDLTNCLRIGDVTVFGNDGSHKIVEVKSDPERRSSAQLRRIRTAEAALQGAGPLPGEDRRARLFDLDVPFRTHLDLLRTGTERAAVEGLFVARVPGDRALFVTDIYGYTAQGWTDDEWGDRVSRKFTAALRRAGIAEDRTRNIHATSADAVSRDPLRVPFAAYPLHPVACARLIGDLAVFYVETSGPALADSLCEAGIQSRWILPPGRWELAARDVLMEMSAEFSSPVPDAIADRVFHRRDLRAVLTRTLQMYRSEMDRYLIEMLDQETWIEGIRYLLGAYDMEGRPWPHYCGENQVWV